ncbi:MAG: NADPH dehydrogenase NamA [Candidatus Izemoplasmatales bacterium]|jgi:NADPH2 dehydrogenase|nr:NADPH dehydrogenase NamA [Candidatus Izemoplasmatales bacterium]
MIFTCKNIGSLLIKNRIVMAPMCMYEATEDGVIQPFHLSHYTTRAYGGVGLIITEATAVESRGRISIKDLGIWKDEHIKGLTSLVSLVHQAGSKIGIQLAHAGRKCTVQDETIISSSPVPFNEKYRVPHEMTKLDIKEVIESFKNAASRAKLCGYDIIEIHGAHGYLINQFLSPLCNERTDEYGGNLNNRSLFLFEVIDAIKSVWGGPLMIRLSVEEYDPEGNHISDSLQLIESLKGKVDAINVSSGGVVPIQMNVFPGYQMDYAKKVKDLGFTTLGGGLITSIDYVMKYLSDGSSDFIYLGRELLRNPYFCLNTAASMGHKELIIKPYERGY